MKDNKAYVLKSDCAEYPTPPFHAAENFPELDVEQTDKGNRIYGMVRKALFGLGMDYEHFGTADWNPFRELVRPGDNVVIKPNLVFHDHQQGRDGVTAMVTHASVLRPVIDYVLKASEGTASITICDAPVQSASWKRLITENHYTDLVEYFDNRGANIKLVDLRMTRSYCNEFGGITKTINLPGDPRGNCVVDLGCESCFFPIVTHSEKLEITGYPPRIVCQHHNSKKNEYLIARTVLESDVLINIPKMKTHQKAGVTLSLKNLIGIIADKTWIAHHRRGSIYSGGDEFDSQPLPFRIRSMVMKYLRQSAPGVFLLKHLKSVMRSLKPPLIHLKKAALISSECLPVDSGLPVVTEGSWYRNDTLWRTILDLNHCALYADADGKLHDNKQRRYFTLVDGILAMEAQGPMEGNPKPAGCLISAFNPVVSDFVTASIMGFNPNKIPSIYRCFEPTKYGLIDFKPEEIEVESNFSSYRDLKQLGWKDSLKFIPPKSWKGHLERNDFL